jgi:Holliday junction resolvase RusA-like endonuclease
MGLVELCGNTSRNTMTCRHTWSRIGVGLFAFLRVPSWRIERMAVELCVAGRPYPWKVYTKRGPPPRSYEYFRSYQEAVQVEALTIWRDTAGRRPPLTCAVGLDFLFCSEGRADLTNLQKAAEDALEGIIIANDAQVIEIQARRQKPGLEGELTIIRVYWW